MRRYTIQDKSNTYTRIHKSQARKLFNAGIVFVICAHKMRPGFPFAMHMAVHSQRYLAEGWTFDQMVANFAHYNCSTNEEGYYPAFYRLT